MSVSVCLCVGLTLLCTRAVQSLKVGERGLVRSSNAADAEHKEGCGATESRDEEMLEAEEPGERWPDLFPFRSLLF